MKLADWFSSCYGDSVGISTHISRSFALGMLLAAVLCFSAGKASAVTFDWDTQTWTAGSPGNGSTATQSYSGVDTGHAGNDVSISVQNTNTNSGWNTAITVDNTRNTGGLSPAQNAMQLPVSGNNSKGIVITINFLYTEGVNDVSLTLWDIDKSAGQYIDKIDHIWATTITGQTVAATTISGSSANSVTLAGTNSTVVGTTLSGATSGNGNVYITFDTTEALQSVSFRWTNTDAGMGQQAIGMFDFSYTVAPEMGSSAAALSLCGIVLLGGIAQKMRQHVFVHATA